MSSLVEINEVLAKFERGSYVERMIESPFIFVVGAPRSGTTLLTQILAYGLGAAYICNIAARFWLAPVTGIQIAREILGNDMCPSFSSRYARTRAPSDIHEFGYFWKAYLGDPPYQNRKIDLCALQLALENIAFEFNRPIVMKGIYPAYYPEQIRSILKGKVIFINIERDPIDSCVSILRARRDRFGDQSEWFAWKPFADDFANLGVLDVYHQIAGQVKWFRDYYNTMADRTVALESVCEDPNKILETVGSIYRHIPIKKLQVRHYSEADRQPFLDIWEG